MAELLDVVEFVQRYCKATASWVLVLQFQYPDEPDGLDELWKAAPILKTNGQCLGDGYGLLNCESEAEAIQEFNRVVGDDGPTPENSYEGPARVYALIVGPEGPTNENT